MHWFVGLRNQMHAEPGEGGGHEVGACQDRSEEDGCEGVRCPLGVEVPSRGREGGGGAARDTERGEAQEEAGGEVGDVSAVRAERRSPTPTFRFDLAGAERKAGREAPFAFGTGTALSSSGCAPLFSFGKGGGLEHTIPAALPSAGGSPGGVSFVFGKTPVVTAPATSPAAGVIPKHQGGDGEG